MSIQKVEINESERKVVITMDLDTPSSSASGKSTVIASSRGCKPSNCQFNGKTVIVGVNCYINKG